jgi:hypothetical protein
MDRPDDINRDPAVHWVTYRLDGRPWGLGCRAECSCGWHGEWRDYRSEAERQGTEHQARPDGETGR